MFETYDFRLTQLRAVKNAMDDFASFQPDDKSASEVGTMIADAEQMLNAAQEAWTDLNLARGLRDSKAADAHETVMSVYAIMTQRYRKDVSSMEAINRLPVKDRSPEQTLARMTSTSKLWKKLPNPPGPATEFRAWDTMGRTEFDALLAGLRDALDNVDDAGEEWDKVNGDLKEMQEEMGDFVTTALVQGRAQFAARTKERNVIDGIPQKERAVKVEEEAVG
jgi:hypothetical protein